ncbi:hypothetical protein [Bradyrhizobium centrosematis]|uniref:hypothetical protein n=1 Tax=Bradyrhizobium centrosematis TaxID=1300039 RepID=UPI00388EAA95
MAKAPVPQLVKLRDSSARRAAGQALAEQDRLNACRREHGLPTLRLIYSSTEVREMRRAMRREFGAELQRTIQHFICPAPDYQRMAKLAIANGRAGRMTHDRAARDWDATVAAAKEIVSEREAADAIVRAGRKRRAEES